MDRVNRSFFVVTTLIAVPAVLVMASLSTGDSPHVQQAIAHEVEAEGTIQQVVGKEIERRQTRPGLFQVITGSREEGNRDHQHANMPSQEPKGLLDGFFDGRSGGSNSQTRSQSTNRTHNHNHSAPSNRTSSRASSGNSSRTNSAQSSGDAWDGIPYHRVDGSQRTTGSQPIRDPEDQIASGPTRIIRGGSNRPTPARTISARHPSNSPTLAPTPAPPLAVPTPPADIEPIPTSGQTLSSRASSRRSNRRELQPLDPSEIEAASKSTAPQVSETELVPRVARKQVARKQLAGAEAAEPTPAQPMPVKSKPVESSLSDSVASDSVTSPTLAKPMPTLQAAPETEAVSAPETALTTIGAPVAAPLPEPVSSADLTPAPAPTESTPTLAATPQLDASTTGGAIAPTRPYAASTPSASVPSISASHRSGPPSNAFQPTEPQFSPTASPVGSGVASGEVASFRRESPTSQPYVGNYTIPAPAAPTQGRMTTFGQPVPSETTPAAQPVAPSQPTANPVYPALPPDAGVPQASDNFARTQLDNPNRMRDNAETAGSTSELPGIRVVTHGPATMMLRQTSQYEIRVENRGAIDATGVMVRAIVPKWAEIRSRNATRGEIDNENQGSTERLVWKIDHLPAGAAEQMFVRLTASQSGTYNLDVDWTLMPQKSITQVQVHEPRLDLTIEGPDEVVYGKSQTYKVRVLNPGDGTAPNVVFTLSPNSATPQSQRIGDIPPGKEAQFDVELTAQDLGDLKIHGLASGDLDLRAEASKTIKVAAARLEAVLSGPELKYQNTDAVYNLQIQNTGAAASEKILASLRMPNGVKYLGGMEEATMQGKTLKWEITALAPGASRDYQFRCLMTSTGEHLFAFDCSGTAAGSANVAIATRVESIADLVLTVSDPPAPAPIGSEVTYEIVIRNRGSKEATDVQTVAQFSHGIEPQRIEGQSGEVVTGQVLFDVIPRIGAGQEIRMRVIAKADRGGHHRFRTEVKAGDTVLVAEEATHYMSPTSERVSRRSSDGSSR